MPTKPPKVTRVDLKHMKFSKGFKGVKNEDFTPIHHKKLVHDPPCASEPTYVQGRYVHPSSESRSVTHS
jgi:hypothetical protein